MFISILLRIFVNKLNTMNTEKEKHIQYAIKLAEQANVPLENISMFDMIIPNDLYLNFLSVLNDDQLISHYKHNIEEERFEQLILIKKELDKRKIKL